MFRCSIGFDVYAESLVWIHSKRSLKELSIHVENGEEIFALFLAQVLLLIDNIFDVCLSILGIKYLCGEGDIPILAK